jgi:hypothetical protein
MRGFAACAASTLPYPGRSWRCRRDRSLVPYKRIGAVDEIGRAAVWLASGFSDYIVGTTLFIDGAMTLYPASRPEADAGWPFDRAGDPWMPTRCRPLVPRNACGRCGVPRVQGRLQESPKPRDRSHLNSIRQALDQLRHEQASYKQRPVGAVRWRVVADGLPGLPDGPLPDAAETIMAFGCRHAAHDGTSLSCLSLGGRIHRQWR